MTEEEKVRFTVYGSKSAKEKLDRMAKSLTHTEQGRSVTLGVIIEFSDEHFVKLEAWYKNKLKESKEGG